MYVRFMISGQLSIMIHYQLVGNHPGILMPDTPPPSCQSKSWSKVVAQDKWSAFV